MGLDIQFAIQHIFNNNRESIAHSGVILAFAIVQGNGLHNSAILNDLGGDGLPIAHISGFDLRVLGVYDDELVTIAGCGVSNALTSQQTGTQKIFFCVGQVVVIGYDLAGGDGGFRSGNLQHCAQIHSRYYHQYGQNHG